MSALKRYLFVTIDTLIPDLGKFTSLRGSIARKLLNIEGGEGLTLGRGVKFDTSTSKVLFGQNINIGSGCKFNIWNKSLTIGSNVYIGEGSRILSSGEPVAVGDNVQIGIESILYANSHEGGTPSRRAAETTGKPLSIGCGSWLGIRVVIHKSVGAGCIIDSGSTVFKEVSENWHVGGNPGRAFKKLPTSEEIALQAEADTAAAKLLGDQNPKPGPEAPKQPE